MRQQRPLGCLLIPLLWCSMRCRIWRRGCGLSAPSLSPSVSAVCWNLPGPQILD
jgi:hypothetical protein